MDADASDVALVVLGAGFGSRFAEGDKLSAPFRGKAVAHHLLDAISPFRFGRRILVHHGQPEWSARYKEDGFTLVENRDRQNGMVSSLHLGAEAATGLTRIMVCLADMPLVTSDHIGDLLLQSFHQGCPAVASSGGDYRGPPAIFSAALLSALPRTGEGGARSLLTDAVLVHCDAAFLRDIDTVDDLNAIEQF